MKNYLTLISGWTLFKTQCNFGNLGFKGGEDKITHLLIPHDEIKHLFRTIFIIFIHELPFPLITMVSLGLQTCMRCLSLCTFVRVCKSNFLAWKLHQITLRGLTLRFPWENLRRRRNYSPGEYHQSGKFRHQVIISSPLPKHFDTSWQVYFWIYQFLAKTKEYRYNFMLKDMKQKICLHLMFFKIPIWWVYLTKLGFEKLRKVYWNLLVGSRILNTVNDGIYI